MKKFAYSDTIPSLVAGIQCELFVAARSHLAQLETNQATAVAALDAEIKRRNAAHIATNDRINYECIKQVQACEADARSQQNDAQREIENRDLHGPVLDGLAVLPT